MGIYQFKCRECDTRKDAIRPVRDHDKPFFCEECGAQMDREVELPARVIPGTYGKGGGRK